MKSISLLPLALLLSAGIFTLTACSEQTAPMKPAIGTEDKSDLIISDVKIGKGDLASAGKNVSVHYTGWLYDSTQPGNKGRKFDSSLDRGNPFTFPLGAGRVIKGWDVGVEGMRVGGLRTLIIPPNMGYGAGGAGAVIPPNATLVFDVELLGVR